jgi:hypothetical protein
MNTNSLFTFIKKKDLITTFLQNSFDNVLICNTNRVINH